ncbi:MAG: M16 family metallopeptidase [Opitutaceae bacterium]
MKLFHSLLLASLTTFCFAADTPPEGIELIRTVDGIEEYRLDSNGLRVLLLPNEGQPVATVMVTYEVGARNEVSGTTGATHILEHMMFKGTDRFNSAEGNDYSSLMERVGARSNATTSFDRTNYFATLPSAYVPLTIELEADRMRNLRIRQEDLDSEMTVVRNEYERGENNPVRTLIKEIFGTAFIAHPYQHPIIGWRSDIENTSPEKLREFYDIYYWPENAVLTVIGGFDKSKTLEAIVQNYGPIPNAPAPLPTVDTLEPEQLGPRRLVIERTGQVGVVMTAYKVPQGTHEDWAALSLLQQILGADKTGRLYRALEDSGKASSTFAYAPQLRDPCLFIFGAYLTPDATHEETEAIILDELAKLISGGVDIEELARAKSVIKASTVYGRDGSYSVASQINESIALGDWTTYITLPKAIQEVTPEEVQRVATKYFIQKNSTTGWFIPQKTQTAAITSSTPYGINYFRDPEVFGLLYNTDEATNTNVGGAAATEEIAIDFSSSMQTATVAGINVIAIDMPIDEVVSFVGSFAAGDTLSPDEAPALASLTASMLDKGTLKNDRFAIAERLDTLGADLGFASSAHSLEFSGRFLRNDAGAVLELLAEQLREPKFDADVLETIKSRQVAGLLQAVDDPDYRAGAAVSRSLYPKDHPNYATPIDALIENVKATTVEGIQAFHQAHYGPKSMTLIFAGDIDFEQLTAAIDVAFEGWHGGVDYPAATSKQLKNKAGSERIYIADKTSVSIRYGYNTGLQRTNDDYLPFMVGNYILGGSFQSRLMQEVRKKQGLTYSVHSQHEGDILTQGNWLLSASFSPALLDQGLEATNAVVGDWYTKGVSEDEVNAAIETLTGSYLVGLSTTGTVAGQVLSFVQRGFDPQYIDAYPKRLQTIDADLVNAKIKQYFNPDKVVLVAAGSLSEAADPATEAASNKQAISVRLDTPNAGWAISIDAIYQTDESLVVISKLNNSSDMAAQVITTVSDTVHIAATEDALPVRHYILGKTWEWGANKDYTFVESMDAFGTALKRAKEVYKK